MDNYENGTVVYEDEEIATIEKPEKIKKRRFIPFWVIVGLFFLVTTAIVVYSIIDSKITDATSQVQLGGLGAILMLIVYGSIGYALTILSSIIGLILTCACRPTTGLRKGQLIYFITFTVLPIIMWAAFYFSILIIF